MAKKKLKTKRRQDNPEDGAGVWMTTFDDELRGRLLRAAAIVAAGTALAAGTVIGFRHLSAHVHGRPAYNRALSLTWEGLPQWLDSPDNVHITRQLARNADLTPQDHLLDPDLARRVGQSLSDQRIGWIEKVERVTVRPDGRVSVKCSFRKPTAWVLFKSYYYLVDERAVRLPGKYDPAECARSNLMMIDGVATSPPDVGETWIGDDLRAGLNLVALLADKPFRHQIDRFLVANYDGRLDPHIPHIELVTDLQDGRVWWGSAPGEEKGLEVTAPQKVDLLEALYREWGRIDMKRGWVNITTFPDQIRMPKLGRSGTGRSAIRG